MAPLLERCGWAGHSCPQKLTAVDFFILKFVILGFPAGMGLK